MRIAVVCAAEIPVPPAGYGGAERVTDAMVYGLVQRGQHVTLYATAGSTCPATELVFRYGLQRELTGQEPWMMEEVRARHRKEPYDCVIDSAGSHLTGRQPDLPVWSRMGGDPFCLFPHDDVRNRVYISPELARFYRCENHPVLRNIFCREPSAIPLGGGDGGYALYVGVIHPMKGLLLAARACRGLRIPFHVAGRVPRHYRDYAKQLEDEGAVFIGELMADPQTRANVFGRAAVFLHPVQCCDADPIAPKEAMAYGTPVVACPCGGIASVVEPRVSGFFARTIAEFVEVIPKAMALDRGEVRNAIMPSLNVDKYCERVELLCRKVAKGETW